MRFAIDPKLSTASTSDPSGALADDGGDEDSAISWTDVSKAGSFRVGPSANYAKHHALLTRMDVGLPKKSYQFTAFYLDRDSVSQEVNYRITLFGLNRDL